MEITFDWQSLTLDAIVEIEDDGIDIESLTYNGLEAGFLLDSAFTRDIYDAAYTAVRQAERKLVQRLKDEQAADRYMEETYA